MDILRQHELFEIEILEKMGRAKLLEPLVFGGGTMLRLCHELRRYSAGLDFWFVKKVSQLDFYHKARKFFRQDYELTDAHMKRYTLLFELRAAPYPKRLKIEIRREIKACDYQQKIAFSRFDTRQVLVKAHTLDQMMTNKTAAFLDRGEIRDCFDIEFLLRRGIALAFKDKTQALAFQNKLVRLKDNDFKVKLGSILEADMRAHYLRHRFGFLQEKLAAIIA